MANETKKLSAKAVELASTPGYINDGGGLYLQISPTGTKSWIYRYTHAGKRREMGLGAFGTGVKQRTLAEAREAAKDAALLLMQGIDPVGQRAVVKAAAAAARATARTFEQCADDYIKAHEAGWKNVKHGQQWRNTLTTYAYPYIGSLPVSDIGAEHVLRVLKPIWYEKNETANRVRGRIESVLDYAKALGFRSGDNPARREGNLEHALPKRTAVAKVEHHEALPYAEIGAFMRDLRAIVTPAARALEFTILTAVRTTEAIEATWEEIDLETRVWAIPAARMKAKAEHRVPLSEAAVRVLEKQQPDGAKRHGLVFPGQRAGKPLSNMAMLTLLQKRMGRAGLTVHGFRSSMRDWAGNETHHAREVIEKVLAHTVKNKTEAAYWREDALDKRAKLMEEWAAWCAEARGQVVKLPHVMASAS